jgi:hypothetical protein
VHAPARVALSPSGQHPYRVAASEAGRGEECVSFEMYPHGSADGTKPTGWQPSGLCFVKTPVGWRLYNQGQGSRAGHLDPPVISPTLTSMSATPGATRRGVRRERRGGIPRDADRMAWPRTSPASSVATTTTTTLARH